MIKNGKDVATGTELPTQVCIVGTGAAGITLAWTLVTGGVDVILIDSGRDFDNRPNRFYEDKKLLYNGEAVGLFKNNEPEFLIRPTRAGFDPPSERELTYGGTSTHWGGQCRPLDPIDFESRKDYPGWPITRDDLDPFYFWASRFCLLYGDYGSHGSNFETEYWAKILKLQKVPTLEGFDVVMYQFMPTLYTQLQKKRPNGQTIADTKCLVIRNATLLNIENQRGSVTKLHVASMDDGNPPKKATEFTIKADAYVLAAGSVANARLLLLSDVANSSGKVGRYFMCHPLVAGYIDNKGNPAEVSGPYITHEQKMFMAGNFASGTQWNVNGVRVEGRFIPSADMVRNAGIGRCWFWADGGAIYFQQAQNPNSRVTLTEKDKTDPVFNQRLTHIDWEVLDSDEKTDPPGDLDKKTYNTTTDNFKTVVEGLGGTAKFKSWEDIKSRVVVNGHHLGTTRMSKEPADGVVNENLRTHDLDNFYVAGASVFPCAGISNPTFTIITLSIRLADHLSKKVGRGGK